MTRLRRRPRAVYRVYGEEEYLAGADTLPVREDLTLAEQATHGRRLQRIAGAAALTGAVGTVGGVVGLAGLRAHAVDRREIAQRVAPSTPGAALRRHASASTHVARDQSQHRSPLRSPSRRTHERGGVSARLSPGTASRVRTFAQETAVSRSPSAQGHRLEIDESSGRPASAGPVTSTQTSSAAVQASAEAPNAAAQASPATEAPPAAQSEFGFER
jgi:hypothetical protein